MSRAPRAEAAASLDKECDTPKCVASEVAAKLNSRAASLASPMSRCACPAAINMRAASTESKMSRDSISDGKASRDDVTLLDDESSRSDASVSRGGIRRRTSGAQMVAIS